MAVTFGEGKVEAERWAYMKAREEERVRRLLELGVRK
jgi:hypothetical protein